MKNLFYFRYINKIGGIETFFNELTEKYSDDYDITIVFGNGDFRQIERLQEKVKVIKWNGTQRFKCERCFVNFNTEIIPFVEADEYIGLIHSDYVSLGINPYDEPKITKYIAVSGLARDSFVKLSNKPCEVSYNPLNAYHPKKVLNLISATRLTEDKGKNRMIQLANILDRAEIPYLWTIFTDDVNAIRNPNIIYMKPRLDIKDYIANADYLVQLSNGEAYCYSVVEALMLGTPVIATKCPVFYELGLNDKNSFLLDFDMENVDAHEIYKKRFSFSYTPKEDRWGEILVQGKSEYKGVGRMKIKVITSFYDLQENFLRKPGDVFSCNELRGNEIITKGYAELVEAEEPKEKRTRRKKQA